MKKISFISGLFLSALAMGYVSDSIPSLDEKSLASLIQKHQIADLESLTEFMPDDMKLNFVLKHGIQRLGERGHLVEKKVSQSSDPHLPRAILWNEKTGFSISFNGGDPAQTANQRLDILSFDSLAKTFSLKKIDFPLTEEQLRRGQSIVTTDASCKECHGGRERPIFSMYPDWPAFYGSDNDELNNPKASNQELEMRDYQNFRTHAALTNARYSPLYNEQLVQKAFGMPIWSTYPFRQDTSEEAKNISRSFTFRPGLRMGIIYNRLNADAVFKTMKEHANYEKMALVTLNSLLQCAWDPKYTKTRALIADMVKKSSPFPPMWIGSGSLQLHYHQIWHLFGLKINDVDIRYSYNHAGYQNIDASKKIMEPGYIGTYFNSYFDGTATIDELIVAKMLQDLSKKYPSLEGAYQLRGLTSKYKHLEARYKFDEAVFKNFDALGMWFPIPYAKAVFMPHHRETFDSKMQQQHVLICQKTKELLREQASRLK